MRPFSEKQFSVYLLGHTSLRLSLRDSRLFLIYA